MAKTSSKVRDHRPAKSLNRVCTRCERCERPHSVYRKFDLCRICSKDLIRKGQIPGLKKASW